MEENDIKEIKRNLEEINNKKEKLKATLKIDEKTNKIKELEEKTLEVGFWNDEKRSMLILSKLKILKKETLNYSELNDKMEESAGIIEILEEEYDNELKNEVLNNIKDISDKIQKLETQTLLSEEYDKYNAIITIHPGAGGTESQDWASMLYRMYTRWAEQKDYEVELFDLQDGDEAGIKSVTFLVKGTYSYGYLKGEKGVHRLVRISPFDSNSRRHTSFAAVEILPEIEDDINIEIKTEDLDIGTFRASGAGGQHVNKTDSAVRIKHLPSGIVVACQTERSQLQNKENAMKMLKAKIYQLEKQKNKEKLQEIKGDTSDNAWGNQIRSYVFCPYTLVKDHRTNHEIGNVQKVMDGYIDEFIIEYLKVNKGQ
ncbi:MAG: peptide chain release factor 2 [Clostridia bacterium]|nr:peptide chain release factor 2 [Clostridia bacterium]MDD4375857.1 peptide chain release factor 2 [Clostridia bacterium]